MRQPMEQRQDKGLEVGAFALFDSLDVRVVEAICVKLETAYGVRTLVPETFDEVRKLVDCGVSCVVFIGQLGTGALGFRLTASFGDTRMHLDSSFRVIPVLLPGGTWEYVKASPLIGS